MKADILTLFNNNSELAETAEGLAKRIRCTPAEAQKEIADLVELGILKKDEVYTFVQDRNRDIQDAIQSSLSSVKRPKKKPVPQLRFQGHRQEFQSWTKPCPQACQM